MRGLLISMSRFLGSAATMLVITSLVACGESAPKKAPRSLALNPHTSHRLRDRHFVAGCEDPRVTGGLPANYRRDSIVVGRLALYPARREWAQQPADSFAPVTGHGPHARFASIDASAVVAPGPPVSIVVPRAEQQMVSLLFDSTRYGDANRGYTVREGDRIVTFPGCSRPYTQYQGGFVVSRAMCAKLLFQVGDQAPLESTIAFGRRKCAGR
jgi:hypothetical protein